MRSFEGLGIRVSELQAKGFRIWGLGFWELRDLGLIGFRV